jgi:hypothetical protein
MEAMRLKSGQPGGGAKEAAGNGVGFRAADFYYAYTVLAY